MLLSNRWYRWPMVIGFGILLESGLTAALSNEYYGALVIVGTGLVFLVGLDLRSKHHSLELFWLGLCCLVPYVLLWEFRYEDPTKFVLFTAVLMILAAIFTGKPWRRSPSPPEKSA